MLLLLIQTHHLNLRENQRAYIAYSCDALNQFSSAINSDLLQAFKKNF